MKILECEQRSTEWFEARLGCITGSNMSKVITASGKPSTQIDTHINELIAQRLIGEIPQQDEPNFWMQRGAELEPQARMFYELAQDVEVKEVGFCKHDILNCGVSPDGLVGDDGGLEIKCPRESTQIKYLRSGKLPAEYKPQVMACLWITRREWWDFLSFHPKLPEFQIRVYRDEEYISSLQQQVTKACETIENEVRKLK